IDSLPVELLAYIFVLGTHALPRSGPQDDDCQPFDSDSVKAPLVYASVSRHWRGVALTTPALYTSLCITPELLREVGDGGAEVLDTTGITSYLALSRNYLVDILIDARDQEWDFDYDAGAWFSADHITAAMAVLLPELGRWRSLSILTDVYAPMHAALRPLEVCLAEHGAPHLESIRLMRCDAYAAHSLVAEPDQLFLSSIPDTESVLLPSLRHLTLRGVPAAWGQLAALLPEELNTLELSFQPMSAQPSVPELAHLLKAAPHLARLVMNDSGPLLPDPADSDVFYPEPIHLPSLTSLTLGYTSAPSALALLHVLAAPALHTLALEDASHPAELLPIDAAPLLRALFPPSAPPSPPLFPALAALALRRVHLTSPSPPVRVARLELVDMAVAPAFEGTQELCVRAPAACVVPAVVALVEAQGAAAAPRVVCLHEAAASAGEEVAEEFCIGATRVRVYRRARDDDEDTVMGSESEWDEEHEAFKLGGVFNDPVFDARYGYVG
ncbi:hypothetical protein C8R46DRAFT_889990, partial [Mycena filopes]